MEVSIDGVAMTESCDEDTLLRDLVDQARERIADRNRLLVKITCDGRELEGAAMEQALEDPLSRYEQIELSTISALDLAADLLNGITGMLAEARDVQAQVVDLLSQGNTVRAMELLSSCFTVWNQAQLGLSRAAEALQVDLDALSFDDTSAGAFIGEVASALRNVRDALESRDYVMLSDILTYEFDELTERWQRLNAALLIEADASGL